MKNKLFDILDTARDLQNDAESAQYRLQANVKKMRRYLDKRAMWKYQHKYSVATPTNCLTDRKTVEDRLATLTKHYEAYTHELLPTMIKDTLATLKASHHKTVAQCEAIEGEATKAPVKPLPKAGAAPSTRSP